MHSSHRYAFIKKALLLESLQNSRGEAKEACGGSTEIEALLCDSRSSTRNPTPQSTSETSYVLRQTVFFPFVEGICQIEFPGSIPCRDILFCCPCLPLPINLDNGSHDERQYLVVEMMITLATIGPSRRCTITDSSTLSGGATPSEAAPMTRR